MLLYQRLRDLFTSNYTARCMENPGQDTLDLSGDFSMENPSNLTRRRPLQNYKHVMITSTKRFTMSGPMFDFSGFQLSYLMPLNNNFLIQSEFNLMPKTNINPKNYMEALMMNARKQPYFTTALNYIYGKGLNEGKPPLFTIVTRASTLGTVEMILGKIFCGCLVKLNAITQNRNGKINPMVVVECEYATPSESHHLAISGESVEYNIFQKLGSSLFLGLEYAQSLQKKVSYLGYTAKYRRNPFESYFLNYMDTHGIFSLANILKLNNKTTICSNLEFTDQGSSFTFGIRRKFGQYELNSALNTDGEIKSNFNIKSELMKLKLYLKANLTEEDFKTGIQLSLGPSNDGM